MQHWEANLNKYMRIYPNQVRGGKTLELFMMTF